MLRKWWHRRRARIARKWGRSPKLDGSPPPLWYRIRRTLRP